MKWALTVALFGVHLWSQTVKPLARPLRWARWLIWLGGAGMIGFGLTLMFLADSVRQMEAAGAAACCCALVVGVGTRLTKTRRCTWTWTQRRT